MKHLKIYKQFINESITSNIDDLLDSINDKKIDFYHFNLSNDNYINKTIEFLYDDSDFNKQLFKKDLKKGEMLSTLYIENFLRKDIDMKFFFIYNRNETILNDPEYIFLQYYKDDKWNNIEIFRITGSVENFYKKLTAKTIKLIYDDITYIYQTSNSGNNWILKDKNKKTDKFKVDLETEDIKNLIKDGVKLKIID